MTLILRTSHHSTGDSARNGVAGAKINDVTARCGCGRQMLVEPLRGNGAFRCGCGIRVLVTIKPPARRPSTRCVGTDWPSGDPCIEAVGSHPHFERLCDKHVVTLFDTARDCVENDLESTDSEEIYRRRRAWRYTMERDGWAQSEDEIVRHMESHRSVRDDTTLDEWQWVNRTMANRPVQSLVYFVLHGNQIKIGTSVNVAERVQALALPAKSLLATEPGGRLRERALHDQFADCHAHGEWFWASPRLQAYIRALPDYRGSLAA